MLKIPDPIDRLRAYDLLDTPPERGFDDIVLLARQLCDTPTALVTLIDRDRQWFKAKSGFPFCETDLDRSVCRFVVEDDEMIEIPDLREDPRTRRNPLVTGEPHIRFYVGAPLRGPHGTFGALCVIDDVPRPAGLTPTQRSLLETLARQVVDVIELRQRSRALETAERARAAGERRWRNLFQTMDEGFVLARVLRDGAGRVHDWCYEEVNAAWGRLLGLEPDAAIGRTVRALIPDIEEEWISEFAAVVETGRTTRFTRQIGAFARWYDGTAQALGEDRFTLTFREVTDRVAAERRQRGLVALGDLLRDEHDVEAMIRGSAAIIGPALGAARAAYGEVDRASETVQAARCWEAPGMPPLTGPYRIDGRGALRSLATGETLAIDDVATDPRSAGDAAVWLGLRVGAVVHVPVREGGRTVALLLVHHDRPHVWATDELDWLHNAADRIEVAIARRRAEEQQTIVNGEIAHRLKNTLSMVQAIAAMTLRKVLPADEMTRFDERLQALARAHDLLQSGRWDAADLSDLAAGVLDNVGLAHRCTVSGPAVQLGARSALSTSLLLHEMATNASKYGALSVPGGTISIDWRIEAGAGSGELVLDWSERNGPPANTPERKGFGSRLISLGLNGAGGAVVRYTPAGLSATFRADADVLERA